jgi:hypothetical protein
MAHRRPTEALLHLTTSIDDRRLYLALNIHLQFRPIDHVARLSRTHKQARMPRSQ